LLWGNRQALETAVSFGGSGKQALKAALEGVADSGGGSKLWRQWQALEVRKALEAAVSSGGGGKF